MAAARPAPLLLSWGSALLLSALLVAAGRRWPEPLPPLPWLVWGLILGPPALMGLWLASRWRRVSAGEEGESTDSTLTQD